MLKPSRWQVELLVMEESFPLLDLEPFRNGDMVGFQGWLRLAGRRTYQMVVEGSMSRYPQEEPRVYLAPHPEEHHWIRSGDQPFLCYKRDNVWSPARSTFASCVAVAVKYLQEFG